MSNNSPFGKHEAVVIERGDPKRWWALGVLCLSLLVIGLDNTILNVALPTLVEDLHATASQQQWIVDQGVIPMVTARDCFYTLPSRHPMQVGSANRGGLDLHDDVAEMEAVSQLKVEYR